MRPTSVEEKQLSWNEWTNMAAAPKNNVSDIKHRKKREKRHSLPVNQGQSFVSSKMKFFCGALHERDKYFKNLDHIALVLLFRAEEKAGT